MIYHFVQGGVPRLRAGAGAEGGRGWDWKDSRFAADAISPGRLFPSTFVFGKKDCSLYSVLELGIGFIIT